METGTYRGRWNYSGYFYVYFWSTGSTKQRKSNIELSDKERRRIIRRSVESQPWKLKCTIAMEEFAELTQAISKQIRGYDNRIGLLEEMADAYICLEFLKSIFNITPEELQKAMDVKLQRERNKQR